MSTATLTPERKPVEPGAVAPEPEPKRTSRWVWAALVIGVWLLVWFFTRGRDTLAIAGTEMTPLHRDLSGFRDDVLAARSTNPIMQFTYGLGKFFNELVSWLQKLISEPAFPRPVPQIGWLGVTALATVLAQIFAGWRSAALVLGTFLSFGLFDYWSDSMDLLIITGIAVTICFVLGIPIGIAMARNRVVHSVITSFLDVMQTFPTFVYLAPFALFFGIGASSAVMLTLVYAMPPIIRITAHGIMEVSPQILEATDSSGQTSWQRLTKVELPMARRTIVVGLNQTTLAALSMATLAAFVDGPGLGQPVLDALKILNVGGGFVPGVLIVAMAIMLDRVTTAASERSEVLARGGGGDPRTRRLIAGIGIAVAAVCVYLSRMYPSLATFPETSAKKALADAVNSIFDWITNNLDTVTEGFKNIVTEVLLNPLQSFLSDSPWWLAALGIAALAYVFGGLRALIPAAVCLTGIYFTDLWNVTMETLTMCLVGVLLVMFLALVVGVAMGRSRRTDLVVRPLLDAGQTIPPFVYLIPVLGLFGVGRFAAILAAVVYAAPVAIKLVADGVKGIPQPTIEASRSVGSTTWQEIGKVQLPMAKSSLVLATNQGLLYVLSMVVIGGLVGAQALGYDVVHGFARSEYWGRGAAAGIAIALLGIMIDRIARAAANRSGRKA